MEAQVRRRTRLTRNADLQEGHGDSPDGRWSVTAIDSRGSHYLDYLSLMPCRSFFDAWEISSVAIIAVGGAQRRAYAPFSPRLCRPPVTAGALMGQDLHPYDGGDVRPSRNYQGLVDVEARLHRGSAVHAELHHAGGAPYLEIARLSTRRPSTAAAVVGRPDAHFDGRPVACVTIFGQRGRLCLRRSVDAVGG